MVIGLSGVQSVCNLTGDLTKSDDLVVGVNLYGPDRIGRHEVLLLINHNYYKICEISGFFKN